MLASSKVVGTRSLVLQQGGTNYREDSPAEVDESVKRNIQEFFFGNESEASEIILNDPLEKKIMQLRTMKQREASGGANELMTTSQSWDFRMQQMGGKTHSSRGQQIHNGVFDS